MIQQVQYAAAACKHNNCQPENSSSQSGMHSNNNNCRLENSGSPSGMHNNNNNCQSENSSSQSECMSPKSAEEEYATVHMLQAARLPGRHEKLVKLQFNKQDVVSTGDFLLEPDQSTLHQLGLDMESTLLNFDKVVVLLYLFVTTTWILNT